MAYGRVSRPDSRGAGKYFAAPILACLLCLVLSGCAATGGFDAALKAIDRGLESSDPKALGRGFKRGTKLAANSIQWLSLLKRADAAERAGDLGRARDTARAALASGLDSETVAAACAWLFLRQDSPEEAYALFRLSGSGPPRLDPVAFPDLWAESFLGIAARARAFPPETSYADLAALAEAAGSPALLLGAAALALSGGDRLSAARYIESAEAAKLLAPLELAWDCGLFDRIAARLPVSARDLAVSGDASFMLGDRGAARKFWELSAELQAGYSWKTQAKLAALAEEEGDTQRAQALWSELRRIFPDFFRSEGGQPGKRSTDRAAAEAAIAYAAWLARSGRAETAQEVLRPFSENSFAAAAALEIAGLSWPEQRYAAEALRLAEKKPDDARAAEAALRALASRGRVEDFVILRELIGRRGLEYPRRWFYEAYSHAALGDYSEAIRCLEAGGPASPDPAAAYNLGLVYAAQGDNKKAAERFAIAAARAMSPRDRSRAFKALGLSLSALGRKAEAKAAWREALRAEPADAEALMLSRGAHAH